MFYFNSLRCLSLTVEDVDDSIHDFLFFISAVPELLHGEPHAFLFIPHWWRLFVANGLHKIAEFILIANLLRNWLIFVDHEQIVEKFDVILLAAEKSNEIQLKDGSIHVIVDLIDSLHDNHKCILNTLF